LENLSTYLEGNLLAHMEGSVAASDTYGKNVTALLGTVTTDPVCFDIGVIPFCINLNMAVIGGIQLQANVTSNIVFNGSSSGYIRFGAMYTEADGFHFISNRSLNYSGQIRKFSSDIQLTSTVFIVPTVVITVDHIGLNKLIKKIK
jgi:hypothetical protein